MTVARITTINFKSKEDADESIKDYSCLLYTSDAADES